MTSAGERVRGLMALLAVVALVGGVPWVLWNAAGAPWPTSSPSSSWLTDELGSAEILSVLLVVLWLAWAHFTVCVVIELVQALRSGRRRQVPGGGVGTQALARRLVAAMLLLAGSAVLIAPTATAVTATSHADESSLTTSAASGSGAAAAQARPNTGHGIGGFDARGVKFAEGKHYIVQPPSGRHYDSLWDISERFLGDGMRWREVHQLNRGVAQPDGGSLQDPDLILPGWRLALPDDARGAGVITVGTDRDHDGSRADNAVGRGDGSGPAREAAPQEDRTSTSTSTAGASGESTPGDLAAQLGVAGGLVAAGLLFGLKRRRGWNGGGGPRGGGGLKPEDEVGLRLAADPAGASVVDRALRQVASAGAATGQSLGTLRAAYLDQESFTLSFATRPALSPPRGWRAGPDGRTWTVDRETALRFDPPLGTPSPFPGLVSVGSGIQDRLVMLDLTSAPGVIALSGEATVASGIALSMAVELATNPWSAGIRVCTVGLDEVTAAALTDIAPDRLRHLRTLDGFLAGHAGDARQLLICFTPPTAEHATALAGLSHDLEHPVSVLVAAPDGSTSASWQLQVAADGRLVNPHLGLDVAAQSLRPGLLSTVAAMFRLADSVRASAGTDLFLSSVPGFPAGMLEATAAPPVSVRVLGPLELHAPGPIDAPRRDLAAEIVTYVALHPAGVHPGVLSSAVWPRGVTPEVFAAGVEHARRWLGDTGAGRPRLAADDQGRLRLDLRDVRVDWHVLQTRYERAQQVADPIPDLAAGLACVQGPVLEDLPTGRYSWLAHSTIVRDIQVLVVAAAVQLAEAAEAAGDIELAGQALGTGLGVVPACEQLWRARLKLTAARSRDELPTTVAQMYSAIDRHGSPRGAEATTTALVEELLPGGGRSRVAQTA